MMKIKGVSIAYLILVLSSIAYAQKREKIDSIQQLLPSLKDSLAIAKSYSSLGFYFKELDSDTSMLYAKSAISLATKFQEPKIIARSSADISSLFISYGELDSALHYASQALSKYRELDDDIGQAYTLGTFAHIYYFKGEYDTVSNYLAQSLSIFTENNHQRGMAGTQNRLGIIAKNQGNYSIAMDYFNQALATYQMIGDKQGEARVINGLGTIYENLEQYDKALEYNRKYYAFCKEIEDKYGMSIGLHNSSIILLHKKKYDSAIIIFKEALDVNTSIGSKNGIAYSLVGLAHAYKGKQQRDTALAYFRRALKEDDDPKVLTSALNGIGDLHMYNKKMDSAVYYQEKGLKIAIDEKLNKESIDILESLYEINTELGNTEKAFNYYKDYIERKEKLFNEQNIRKIANVEAKYEYDKKRREQEIEEERRISKVLWVRNTSIGGTAIASVLAALIFINYRRKKRDNEKLNLLYSKVDKQAKELKKLDKTKSRFFSNISHELRTPLTLISSPLQYILNRKSPSIDPEIMEELNLINRNTEKLKGLVDDILSLSKLESDKLINEPSDVHISDFVARVYDNFKSLAEHLKVNYEITLEHLTSKKISIDHFKLEKIINNLVSNALKYTPAGGQIDLKAWDEEGKLFIQVTDTGDGISAEDLPYIFDRFYQSRQPDAPIQGGTGIGLALAKELITVMKGDISVDSEVGKGSSFTLNFPYNASEELKNSESKAKMDDEAVDTGIDQLSTESLKNARVLIVEDHPEMQQFVKKILSKDYSCSLASNGKQALEILESEDIDLVVTDVMMPTMDGHELLKNIRLHNRYYNIPVIMLTALKNESSKLEALSAGVDDYLTKPFSPEELTARVRNMIIRYGVKKEVETDEEESDEHTPAYMHGDANIGELKFIHDLESNILKELENEDFSIADLADQFHVSYRQFVRKVKKVSGLSPKQFQQEVALQKARRLLEDQSHDNATTIAYSIGMYHVTRFSKLYEERFGKKPSSYFN